MAVLHIYTLRSLCHAYIQRSDIFIGAVNESTVGVGGDSAGGRIAASVCHEELNINYQVRQLLKVK